MPCKKRLNSEDRRSGITAIPKALKVTFSIIIESMAGNLFPALVAVKRSGGCLLEGGFLIIVRCHYGAQSVEAIAA